MTTEWKTQTHFWTNGILFALQELDLPFSEDARTCELPVEDFFNDRVTLELHYGYKDILSYDIQEREQAEKVATENELAWRAAKGLGAARRCAHGTYEFQGNCGHCYEESQRRYEYNY